MKMFVCDYHVNDLTTFLHFQIQVCSAHARILASGNKSAFSGLRVHGLVIFGPLFLQGEIVRNRSNSIFALYLQNIKIIQTHFYMVL